MKKMNKKPADMRIRDGTVAAAQMKCARATGAATEEARAHCIAEAETNISVGVDVDAAFAAKVDALRHRLGLPQ